MTVLELTEIRIKLPVDKGVPPFPFNLTALATYPAELSPLNREISESANFQRKPTGAYHAVVGKGWKKKGWFFTASFGIL
jgi:hypothetical protein